MLCNGESVSSWELVGNAGSRVLLQTRDGCPLRALWGVLTVGWSLGALAPADFPLLCSSCLLCKSTCYFLLLQLTLGTEAQGYIGPEFRSWRRAELAWGPVGAPGPQKVAPGLGATHLKASESQVASVR